MKERTGEVTFKGNPLTVIGERLKIGDTAPEFALIANDLSTVRLSDSSGKVRLVSVVPSLDTGICDEQTRKFNQSLRELGDGVIGFTISADLPFAQARWCGAAGVDNMTTLSDHRDMAFGQAYGLHIKELRLDARAVFVLDAEGKITHAEYVAEVASHPNYDAALEAVKAALN